MTRTPSNSIHIPSGVDMTDAISLVEPQKVYVPKGTELLHTMAQTWISVNHTITTSDAQEKLRDEASALSAKIQEFLRNKNMQNLHIHVADDRLIRDCNYHFSYGDEPPIDDQRRQKIGKIIQKSVEDYDELKRIFDAAGLHDSWSTETLHHLGSQFEKRNTFFVDIVPLENEADYRQYLSDIQREAITLHTEVKSFLENTGVRQLLEKTDEEIQSFSELLCKKHHKTNKGNIYGLIVCLPHLKQNFEQLGESNGWTEFDINYLRSGLGDASWRNFSGLPIDFFEVVDTEQADS